MGEIHAPPLSGLALGLARAGDLRRFIETGTFLGHSLKWAAQNFERVWTIEINAEYQRQAMENAGALPNVTYVLGNSADHIARICGELDGPALFWLDAHAGAGFFGPNENCPLLDEIRPILASPHPHCILIDDARAFVAAPPPPFDYRKWPSLDEVMRGIFAKPDYHVSVITDVMIAVPAEMRDLVAQYAFVVRPKI
ncbi:MAG: hypothetical protein QOF19_265 [Alphaproteobacteria bacterium]|jgi:hypothetical protein|nr:hypothetical protein [Alphaproteobacteria bacterium]